VQQHEVTLIRPPRCIWFGLVARGDAFEPLHLMIVRARATTRRGT